MKYRQHRVSPSIIKPYRATEKPERFKPHKCIHKLSQGIETNFIFDLNVLSWMNEVVKKKASLKSRNLSQLVKTMNKAHALSLSPGFALHEASCDWIGPIRDSFEEFIDMYCPSYRDHPSAIRSELNAFDNTQDFNELRYAKKAYFSEAYLATLRLHIMSKRLQPDNRISLYSEFLAYMSRVADIVGAVEAEIAKYVFFDFTTVGNRRHRLHAQKIQENFLKWNPKPEQTLKNCLNITHDLMYFRLTAFMADQLFDGRKQENWLVTGDQGIRYLSEALFFYTEFDGSNSNALVQVRNQSQESSEYWKVCDALFEQVNALRNPYYMQQQKEWNEAEYDRLIDLVKESEDELRSL